MAESSSREIVSQRLIAAPRERVFRAFSDPGELAAWWGPKGFTNSFTEFDFRPGGRWRFTMRAPDGSGYAIEKRWVEIVPPKCLVLRHDQASHEFTMTITLDERGAATELIWRMVFDSAAECARVREFVARANEENFDRLEARLAATA